MKIRIFSSMLLYLGLGSMQDVHAHSHKTYIVEQPTYVIVQPAAQTPEILVEQEPPADVVEEMGTSPGYNYVWVKGHWQWDGSQWVRIHGQWVLKPSDSALWVPGYWTKHHDHWRWTEGYWR